ncbi:ABC-2 type transporter [Trinorchestia longiramus]|nr:ABC-2 type transporter [Trinorchestia longiramus]
MPVNGISVDGTAFVIRKFFFRSDGNVVEFAGKTWHFTWVGHPTVLVGASCLPVAVHYCHQDLYFKSSPFALIGEDWLCRAGVPLRWSGVSVSVSGKTLLSGVSGHCAPGRIFAIMGPSGSGKTTLLNALSGRVRCEGSIHLGGRPLSRKLRHLVGYSTQHDLFHPHLKLRQMLQFTADLRLPETLSKEQKTAAVDSVIAMLALTQCQNTIIGDGSVRGLSGGERKRASIACELLTDPPVLVLDEPTSGLDAHAAHALISRLKSLAVGEGRSVLLSLHQPSSRVFHMLDTVLLLTAGRPAYMGPSRDVAPYLAKLGLPLQPNYNPADYLLEVATDHSDRLVRHYEECQENEDMKQSTSPPQWVFQQHLSSLSSDPNCKKAFQRQYHEEKTLIKDTKGTRISSLSLPENDRLPSTDLPDSARISSSELHKNGRVPNIGLNENANTTGIGLLENARISSQGLLENARISSQGLLENAGISSQGLSDNANVSSLRLHENTNIPSTWLSGGRNQRFTSDTSTIGYTSEVGASVKDERSFEHLAGGALTCVCGNVFLIDCDAGGGEVLTNHFDGDNSRVVVHDSHLPVNQETKDSSNFTTRLADKRWYNGVIESSNHFVDVAGERRSLSARNSVPNSTKEYPLYVAQKFSTNATEDIDSFPQVLSCSKCTVKRGHDLHDARSYCVPMNDNHDSGYDQNRDPQRLSGSFHECRLPQNMHPSFSSDPILNKGVMPCDDSVQECPIVNGTRNRSVRRDESDSGRESCSSDHSYAASCLAASALPFATSRRISHNGVSEARWPASYWTQCRVRGRHGDGYGGGTGRHGEGYGGGTREWVFCMVLTARCFAVYRPIITSKINWVQTLGFALLAGVLWFQAPRTEEGITDLQGWMFFSTSYWMMHSHFQALNTFPREKAVLEKERSSGWYRISAYYIAKSVSELPLTIALPSLYFVISYPLMGFSGVSVMLLLLLMLLLNALVAQSLGLLVSVTFCNIEHCWAVSALITLFQQLFGGYLATRVPPWMEWARYLSMVQYAYSNMCYIEFSMGPPVTCAPELSRFPSCASGDTETVPVSEILAASGADLASAADGSPVWINTTALLLYLITARLLAYLVLRFRYRPNY